MQVEMRAGVIGLLLLGSANLEADTGGEVLPRGFLEFLGNMVEMRHEGETDPDPADEGGTLQGPAPDESYPEMGELVDPLALDPEQEVDDE